MSAKILFGFWQDSLFLFLSSVFLLSDGGIYCMVKRGVSFCFLWEGILLGRKDQIDLDRHKGAHYQRPHFFFRLNYCFAFFYPRGAGFTRRLVGLHFFIKGGGIPWGAYSGESGLPLLHLSISFLIDLFHFIFWDLVGSGVKEGGADTYFFIFHYLYPLSFLGFFFLFFPRGCRWRWGCGRGCEREREEREVDGRYIGKRRGDRGLTGVEVVDERGDGERVYFWVVFGVF